MAIIPEHTLKENNSLHLHKQFTDREKPQEYFLSAIQDIALQDYTVLSYYGVGGIGKSSLLEHLTSEHLSKNKNNIYSVVDFELENHRIPHQAISVLTKGFKTQFKVPFTAFDIAYIVYWNKAFPDSDIKKQKPLFLEEGGIVADGVNILYETAAEAISTIKFSLDLIGYVADKLNETSFDKKIQQKLKALHLEDAQIVLSKLPLFFAYDLKKHLKKYPEKKMVIFFDTYEALWKTKRSCADELSQDDWVRELVAQLPKTLFVIFGRDKLQWEKVNADWSGVLDQHKLGNLSELDSRYFLNSCDIKDSLIQEAFYTNSKGVPYYLDLAVEVYYQMLNIGEKPTAKIFERIGNYKIFERFMRYLTPHESETLHVLANARFYTKAIFSDLITHFKTGYPVTAMSELNKHSFISEEDGVYFVHQLMRESLTNNRSDDLNTEVHEFLFNYYDNQIKNIVINDINKNKTQALIEASYHLQHYDEKQFPGWSDNRGQVFFEAYMLNELLPLWDKAIDISNKQFGKIHPSTVTSLNNLAALYRSQGKYDEAEHLYQQSLSIREETLGKTHPDMATLLNNLAVLYQSQGKYDKAEPLFKQSLSIRKETLGKRHPDVATLLNNLAALYESQGKYDEAEHLYQQSLSIWEESLGKTHPKMAALLNNLAVLYQSQGKYDEAEPLFKQCLSILEEALDKTHPDVANSLKNLAVLYLFQGKFDEAKHLFNQSIPIRKIL